MTSVFVSRGALTNATNQGITTTEMSSLTLVEVTVHCQGVGRAALSPPLGGSRLGLVQ